MSRAPNEGERMDRARQGHRGDGERGSSGASPTYPPPQPTGLTPVLERNIHALEARRLREETHAPVQERIADAVTRFTGSMLFVYLHLEASGCGSLRISVGSPACRG